jgi:hypothetical protein
MIAKRPLGMAICALVMSAGMANAGPCNSSGTTGIGGSKATNRSAQAEQRQEHAQPSVAQQPRSTGNAAQPSTAQQTPEPSAKMTDEDRFSATGTHVNGSDTSAKMADQDC